MPPPWIFTFYSYKGGVGRSMAAANVAYALAGRGRHVLVVDMDLEAPGLSGFLERNGELEASPSERSPDVITLLADLLIAFRSGQDPKAILAGLPPVSESTRPVAAARVAGIAPPTGQTGRLDVLGADQKRNYSERLAALGLNKLSHSELEQVSNLLRSYLKAQRFLHRPFWLEEFESAVTTPYDYVIVDSRTGLTEIGGLCIGPLADRLVVVSGLNDQNIEGTRAFLEEVGLQPKARERTAEQWDDLDPVGDVADSGRALGPKPTIIVASPVPAGEIEAKQQRLKEMENRLGIVPVQISYHPQMALMESLFVRDYRDEYLTSQYLRLTGRVQALVGDDENQISAALGRWLTGSRIGLDWKDMVRLAVRLAAVNPTSQLLPVLHDAAGEHNILVLKPLIALMSRDESYQVAGLSNWGNALSAQAKTKQGLVADRCFEASYLKYAEAIRLKPDHADAFSNWGNALSAQAKTKRGSVADRLFEASYLKYAEAIRLKPDYAAAFNNWGATLLAQAKIKQGEASPERDIQELLAQAKRRLLEAQAKGYQGAEFNLGCAEAISGNVEQCIDWLRQVGVKQGAVTRRRIGEEPDFDLIRQTPPFVQFVDSLPE